MVCSVKLIIQLFNVPLSVNLGHNETKLNVGDLHHDCLFVLGLKKNTIFKLPNISWPQKSRVSRVVLTSLQKCSIFYCMEILPYQTSLKIWQI